MTTQVFPTRWITVHQKQIAKNIRPYIQTSHPIDVIKADLSMLICYIWAKSLPWYYENKRSLYESQQGNHAHRHIQSTTTKKIYTADIFQIIHHILKHAETDLRNFFDRILLFISKIFLCLLGINADVCYFQIKWIKGEKYQVKIVCSTSVAFFCDNDDIKKGRTGPWLVWRKLEGSTWRHSPGSFQT